MMLLLYNEGIKAADNALPKDVNLLKIAIKLVLGYVESSRTEGGVSVGIDSERVEDNIRRWCDDYGLDAEDFLSLKTIENGTNLW